MPKLTNIETKESREVKPNNTEDLIDKAEELGVLFGCQDGRCGACRVEVTEGMENLSERTENEKDLGVEEPHRLMCQCKMKGDVNIKT
tara:strand:- start:1350 stop:1613 length:264 start_codon:yes stop_codon:yes gene_type:complete